MKTLLLFALMGVDVESRLDALEARMHRVETAVFLPLPNSVYLPAPVIEELPRDPAPPRRKAASSVTVVPANHHAHHALDGSGRIIVHHNSNNGVPGAHDGMSRVRIAEGGQVLRGDGCPPRGCPVQSRFKVNVVNKPRGGLFGWMRK